jgi:hypothetical protein
VAIDSGSKGMPKKHSRAANPGLEADISPGLQELITKAARQIRAVHKAELADVMKADRAGQLFRSTICPYGIPPGTLRETSGVSGDGVDALAREFGGLLSDAIHAGTGLLEGSLTILTHAWMATVIRPLAKPELRTSSITRPVPAEPSSSSQMLSTTDDTAIPGAQVPEMPAVTPEDAVLRRVFRQFVPMVLTALSQGGDGYGLAETVIRLFGRLTYDQACGLGKDRIMQLAKSEPDLWAEVAPIEAKFSQFLDEFTGYDAWIAEQAHPANERPRPSRRRRTKPPTENG